MIGAVPFIIFGFVKYNGMPAEKVIKAWIRSEIMMPRYLLFKGEIGEDEEVKEEQ